MNTVPDSVQPFNPPWGNHTLRLGFPTGQVKLSGLSASQYSALNHTYSAFIQDEAITLTGCLDCRVYRLPSQLPSDPAALTVDGVYTPLKARNEVAIDVTGHNFKASLPNTGSHGPASLGVAMEHELPRPDVFENFLRIYAAHRSLSLNGVVLHSAGLLIDGRAYIFVGRSNTGKTTLTHKAYEQGGEVLSDDVNLLLPVPGGSGYNAHAMPFTGEFAQIVSAHSSGKHLSKVNAPGTTAPVAALVLLEQGECLQAERVSPAIALARLMVGCPFVNTDTEEYDRLFNILTSLVSELPVMRLTNRREDDINDITAQVRRLANHDG